MLLDSLSASNYWGATIKAFHFHSKPPHIFPVLTKKTEINSNVVVAAISPTFSGLEECYLGIAQTQKPRHKTNPQVPTSNLSVLAYPISCAVLVVRNLGVHTVHSSDWKPTSPTNNPEKIANKRKRKEEFVWRASQPRYKYWQQLPRTEAMHNYMPLTLSKNTFTHKDRLERTLVAVAA